MRRNVVEFPAKAGQACCMCADRDKVDAVRLGAPLGCLTEITGENRMDRALYPSTATGGVGIRDGADPGANLGRSALRALWQSLCRLCVLALCAASTAQAEVVVLKPWSVDPSGHAFSLFP
ncbi:MAG: hypothetical protein U1F26_16290 [Lysobacterales bacterium]